jgi:prepilin-type processing-associated H-X9-DG protein
LWVENRNGEGEPFDRSSYCFNGYLAPVYYKQHSSDPNDPFSATATVIYLPAHYGISADYFRRFSAVAQPNTVPVMADGVWRNAFPGAPGTKRTFLSTPQALTDPETYYSVGNNDNIWRFLTNRHKDVTNVAFVDGHVESVFLKDMFKLKWHKNYRTDLPIGVANP